MATFYLVRHGKPDYSEMWGKGFFGFGRNFAPLSEEGVKQAEETSKDERLRSADIIVSSPYTRAMQTAQIISKNTGINVAVEVDLHEWIPDWTNQDRETQEIVALTKEFNACKGVYPEGETKRWETLEDMRIRIRRVADQYAKYERVIIVAHGMAFRALTYIENMEPAEIIECTYEIGQEDCVYSFTVGNVQQGHNTR